MARLSNARRETLWIDGWENLWEQLNANPDRAIITKEWEVITLEGAQELIQDQAYQERQVSFSVVWYEGKQALQLDFKSVSES